MCICNTKYYIKHGVRCRLARSTIIYLENEITSSFERIQTAHGLSLPNAREGTLNHH